jgi:hypothetical protein
MATRKRIDPRTTRARARIRRRLRPSLAALEPRTLLTQRGNPRPEK